MTAGGRGRGRKPSAGQQVAQAQGHAERALRVACLPSSQPRPSWMDNPSELPKKPPRHVVEADAVRKVKL